MALLTDVLSAIALNLDPMPLQGVSSIALNAPTLLVCSLPDQTSPTALTDFGRSVGTIYTTSQSIATSLPSDQLGSTSLALGTLLDSTGTPLDVGLSVLIAFCTTSGQRALTGTSLNGQLTLPLTLADVTLLQESGIQVASARGGVPVLQHDYSLVKVPGDTYAGAPYRFLTATRVQQLLWQQLQRLLCPLIGSLAENMPTLGQALTQIVEALPAITALNYTSVMNPVAGTIQLQLTAQLANATTLQVMVST